jgi:hypothetical protein
MGDDGMLEAEMIRARAMLATARTRMAMYRRAHAGAVERDLERRLQDALRQVRWLETAAAAALLVS